MSHPSGTCASLDLNVKFALAMASSTAGWMAPILFLQAANPRILASWHGFLHAAIASAVVRTGLPPENPFFAGEPLRYYYVYHWVSVLTSAVLPVDPLQAFQILTLFGLACLIFGVGLAAKRMTGSNMAATVAGLFALAGLNPLGPLLAGARAQLRGQLLWHDAAHAAHAAGDLYVTNRLADQWMIHPLLPKLYVSNDWRFGNDLVWFLDNSSRGLGLGLFALLCLVVLSTGARVRLGSAAAAVLGCAVSALNPLLGLAGCGALAAGAIVARAIPRRREADTVAISPALAACAGAVAAFPSYALLFGQGEAVLGLSPGVHLLGKTLNTSANFLLLLPLALLARAHARSGRAGSMQPDSWIVAATLLLLTSILTALPENNEHNLANLAQVLLAVPAAAGLMRLRSPVRFAVAGWCILQACAIFVSFAGRPAMPLVSRSGELRRAEAEDGLHEAYRWIRDQTAERAVLVTDPARPIKMSGNVSELPALSGRSLFVDQRSYLIEPYPDMEERLRVAGAIASGSASEADIATVTAHGRPVYLLSTEAASQERIAVLTRAYGPPALRSGIAAIFAIGAQPEGWAPEFAGYLGGAEVDQARDVAIDREGNVYVTGGTASDGFPAAPRGVASTTIGGASEPGPGDARTDPIAMDVFITKLSRSGELVWTRRLGGPGYDRAYAVEVDVAGNVYLAGRAGGGFPVSAGAFQTRFMGGTQSPRYGSQDGFVCKLTAAGERVFCSYFGSGDPMPVRDLAVAADGTIYLASGSKTADFPQTVARAFNNRPRGGGDAVAAKISPDGGRVLWATYLGGSGRESHENSIRLDATGNPFVLFTTESTGIATPGAFSTRYSGHQDVFAAKLDPADGSLVWGTYFGGSGNESTETHEFAVDAAGHAYIAAPTTFAPDFPVTAGCLQPSYGGGGNDMFVAKLSADGSELLAATFLGGAGKDRPEGVAVDPSGRVYVTGTTTSRDFPVTADAAQPKLRGERDSVAVVLSPALDMLIYATFLGGSGIEYGRGMAVSSNSGLFVIGGDTSSGDWPARPPLPVLYGGGPSDGFVAAFAHK